MASDIVEPVIRYTFIAACFIIAAMILDGGWQSVAAYFHTCH